MRNLEVSEGVFVAHYGRKVSEAVLTPCCRIIITFNTDKLIEEVRKLQGIVTAATKCLVSLIVA